MACKVSPAACRREHIARLLSISRQIDDDFETRCPLCGHRTFRISQPKVSKYRHVWTCACKERCGCDAGRLRSELIRRGADRECLGVYDGDGDGKQEIPQGAARRYETALRDIIAAPGLKPADIRIIIFEALGNEVPRNYTDFVKFAKQAGVGHNQAYEAARREFGRPSDCRPSNPEGQVVDTSRNTGQGVPVKPRRSGQHGATETVEQHYGNRRSNPEEAPTVSVERTQKDKKHVTRKPAA